VPNWRELTEIFKEEMETAGMEIKIPTFEPRKKTKQNSQLTLFGD
jgi:hypothetical protein